MGNQGRVRKCDAAVRHLVAAPLLNLAFVVPLVAQDPTILAGPVACQECHVAAYQVLQYT